jgi:hypothetical protein
MIKNRLHWMNKRKRQKKLKIKLIVFKIEFSMIKRMLLNYRLEVE